jgi:hypothetical protein
MMGCIVVVENVVATFQSGEFLKAYVRWLWFVNTRVLGMTRYYTVVRSTCDSKVVKIIHWKSDRKCNQRLRDDSRL